MTSKDFTQNDNEIIFDYFYQGKLYYTVGKPNFENRSWDIYSFPINPSDLRIPIQRHEKAKNFDHFIDQAIDDGCFTKLED